MLVLRATEVAAQGWAAADVVQEFARVRARCGGFLTVATLDRLPRSGRVGRPTARLGSQLNIKPILSISVEGTVDQACIVAPITPVVAAQGVFYQIADGTNA